MCGRYVLRSPPARLREQFAAEFDAPDPHWVPRYNVAPLQFVPVLRVVDGHRRIEALRWGLVPSWAGDAAIAARLINARAETVASKPSFRAAYRARRCIVPADGFYEWQPRADVKQPFYISRRDGRLLALAGLWEHWSRPPLPPLLSFTVLTTEANAWMRPLHERMPVMLADDAACAAWLDASSAADALDALLGAAPDDALQAWEVDRAVGNARRDGAELIDALAPYSG